MYMYIDSYFIHMMRYEKCKFDFGQQLITNWKNYTIHKRNSAK